MNTLNAFLDKYGRFGLDAATAASTLGFAAAKATTKLVVRLLSYPHRIPSPSYSHLRASPSSASPVV